MQKKRLTLVEAAHKFGGNSRQCNSCNVPVPICAAFGMYKACLNAYVLGFLKGHRYKCHHGNKSTTVTDTST